MQGLRGHPPERFDWSIMGWTILLLALMNLAEEERKNRDSENIRGGQREIG